ncbi:Protein of unknown function [Marinobacter daqiaonensis]|uniref:DUF2878 domain-containing protein n=1 Tax=Marinobacter daqiaonensis TaxID=650891 RepID=A0A1I6GTT4_9GAMM|nr:DUF2878 domain-containing protein [Marinobacter daqiaonensis]SFR45580.1 Protein of unknown function [Marinobacter daqiaonensis]
MARDTTLKVINFLLFQAGWFLCVWLTNWIAVVISLVIVMVHLTVISRRPWPELRFILLGVVLGTLLDGLWFQTGILRDASGSVWTPPWLMAIWALFLTTPGHSLVWMQERLWLPFVLAPVAGPFAYFAANRLDAISFPHFTESLVALALGWLLIFPLLLWLQRHFFRETMT